MVKSRGHQGGTIIFNMKNVKYSVRLFSRLITRLITNLVLVFVDHIGFGSTVQSRWIDSHDSTSCGLSSVSADITYFTTILPRKDEKKKRRRRSVVLCVL